MVLITIDKDVPFIPSISPNVIFCDSAARYPSSPLADKVIDTAYLKKYYEPAKYLRDLRVSPTEAYGMKACARYH